MNNLLSLPATIFRSKEKGLPPSRPQFILRTSRRSPLRWDSAQLKAICTKRSTPRVYCRGRSATWDTSGSFSLQASWTSRKISDLAKWGRSLSATFYRSRQSSRLRTIKNRWFRQQVGTCSTKMRYWSFTNPMRLLRNQVGHSVFRLSFYSVRWPLACGQSENLKTGFVYSRSSSIWISMGSMFQTRILLSMRSSKWTHRLIKVSQSSDILIEIAANQNVERNLLKI